MDQEVAISNTIKMYTKFCDDIGIDAEGHHFDNLRIMLLLFQKNMDTRSSYVEILPHDPFLDWSMLENIRTMRIYKDALSWVTTLNFFELQCDDVAWRNFAMKYKIFSHFIQSLNGANLTLEPLEQVKLFCLVHILNLQSTNIIELFFSFNYNRPVKIETLNFLGLLADVCFDRKDRTDVITHILRNIIQLKTQAFVSELELQKSKETKLTQIFKQKAMQATTLRPRLRSKLKSELLQQSALATLDTFQSWCDAIRFPNVFSQCYKKKIYFIMSQSRMEFSQHLHHHVLESDLCQTVSQYQVKNPDVHIILDVISQSRLVSEPFAEIHKFREKCFDSFSMVQKSKLRLNDILHLYIASYQNDNIWKTVWKNIISIISIQIIKDVETFVNATPFNAHAVMAILFHNHTK